VALLVAVVVVALLLFGGSGSSYEVTAEFENASQLVKGSQVVVGGVPTGSVKDIQLGDHGQALVTFSVSDDYAPLSRGTTATIRSYSLSGIANRQVQLTLPPQGQEGAPIPDGGTLSESETVSEVDLDEVFNTLNPRTIKNFKHVIEGFNTSYAGVSKQANTGYRYLNPFLSTSRNLFNELTRDEPAFERLLVDTSHLSGALAARAPDLSLLIHNVNLMMGALGRQKEALAESIAKFPDFMREADTTFVNLRATLDDLDPLVQASKPVARKLQPFFSQFRATAHDAVPTIADLDQIVRSPGADNDLVDLTRLQVPLARTAIGSGSPACGNDPATDYQAAADNNFKQGAFGESVCSLRNGLPPLSFFRPYTPELVGWFDDFSHPGYIDAAGGVGRIATTFNTFSFSAGGLPELVPPSLQNSTQTYSGLTTDLDQKCPGANERPLDGADPSDNSVPFLDGNNLDCDPTDLPPGP